MPGSFTDVPVSVMIGENLREPAPSAVVAYLADHAPFVGMNVHYLMDAVIAGVALDTECS